MYSASWPDEAIVTWASFHLPKELLFSSNHDESWCWMLLLFPAGMSGGPAPGSVQIQSGFALCKDWSLPPSYSHCGDLKWISSCWHDVVLGCSKAGLYIPSWALVSFRTISDLLHFLVCLCWVWFYVWSRKRAGAGGLWSLEKALSLFENYSRDVLLCN